MPCRHLMTPTRTALTFLYRYPYLDLDPYLNPPLGLIRKREAQKAVELKKMELKAMGKKTYKAPPKPKSPTKAKEPDVAPATDAPASGPAPDSGPEPEEPGTAPVPAPARGIQKKASGSWMEEATLESWERKANGEINEQVYIFIYIYYIYIKKKYIYIYLALRELQINEQMTSTLGGGVL